MKFEKQNIFFCSDLHLGHHNVIQYDSRPFVDVDEMNNELVKRWNSVVEPDDIVFYLGDLSMGKSDVRSLVHELKGKIHFVLGNHDKMKDIVKLGRFESIHPYGCEILVKDDDVLKSGKKGREGFQHIVLSHYPILSWNKAHHGTFHLHGHCHGSMMINMPEYYNRKVIDVGVSCIDYTPISYTQVKEVMSKKQGLIPQIDHHQ